MYSVPFIYVEYVKCVSSSFDIILIYRFVKSTWDFCSGILYSLAVSNKLTVSFSKYWQGFTKIISAKTNGIPCRPKSAKFVPRQKSAVRHFDLINANIFFLSFLDQHIFFLTRHTVDKWLNYMLNQCMNVRFFTLKKLQMRIMNIGCRTFWMPCLPS